MMPTVVFFIAYIEIHYDRVLSRIPLRVFNDTTKADTGVIKPCIHTVATHEQAFDYTFFQLEHVLDGFLAQA